jgi:hypothetical protein
LVRPLTGFLIWLSKHFIFKILLRFFQDFYLFFELFSHSLHCVPCSLFMVSLNSLIILIITLLNYLYRISCFLLLLELVTVGLLIFGEVMLDFFIFSVFLLRIFIFGTKFLNFCIVWVEVFINVWLGLGCSMIEKQFFSVGWGLWAKHASNMSRHQVQYPAHSEIWKWTLVAATTYRQACYGNIALTHLKLPSKLQ